MEDFYVFTIYSFPVFLILINIKRHSVIHNHKKSGSLRAGHFLRRWGKLDELVHSLGFVS